MYNYYNACKWSKSYGRIQDIARRDIEGPGMAITYPPPLYLFKATCDHSGSYCLKGSGYVEGLPVI
jgi:hypothetical protein